eukprot:scaffold283362_cov35-Tisochrysis_lutea.AAC.1
MAPKKKGESSTEAGKPKPLAPSAEAMAALELQLSEAERKLLEKTLQQEAGLAAVSTAESLLSQSLIDHADREAYLKSELRALEVKLNAAEASHAAAAERATKRVGKLEYDLSQVKQIVDEAKAAQREADARQSQLNQALADVDELRASLTASQERVSQLQEALHDAQHDTKAAQAQLQIVALPSRSGDSTGARVVPLILIDSIRAHMEKPALVEQACTAIASTLAGDAFTPPFRDNCVALVEAGGIATIAAAMREHAASAPLQAAACALLWKLALTEPSCREPILAEGGVELVMKAMSAHLTHARLQYNACGALRQLLVNNVQAHSAGSSISPMRKAELPPLVQDGSRRKLSAGGAPALHQGGGATVGGKGSRPAPLKGVRSNRSLPNLAPIVTSPSGRLPTTIPSPPPRMDEAVTAAAPTDILEQALGLTFRSMDEQEGQPLVQEYGCGTLRNLVMASPELKSMVVERGGVDRVVRAMEMHSSHSGVLFNACAVLKQLCDHTKAIRVIKAAKADRPLSKVISNHHLNLELQELAKEVLMLLPEDFAE